MNCETYEVKMLRKEILRLQMELDEERASSSRSVDLLLKGESMREALMLKAICAGAFSPPVSEPESGEQRLWIIRQVLAGKTPRSTCASGDAWEG